MPQKLKPQYYKMKKNLSPLTLKSKRKIIIKSSKGLIIEAIRGNQSFVDAKHARRYWIKKILQFVFFGIPIRDKSFQQSASTMSNKESVSFWTKFR